MAAPPPVWTEFSHGMCEQLNSHRCLVFVGDATLQKDVTAAVDDACSHSAVVAAFSSLSPACVPAAMPHVAFTTPANQQTAQRCMAIYGRIPFLAVLDMREDGEEHAFVLDVASSAGAEGTLVNSTAFSAAVVDFLVRVGRGTEPRSRQGAAPPPADLFAPTHGAVLCEARAAVTSTFTRLLGKSTSAASTGCHCPCGALCVFWSDRCPCCPGVLMLLEAVVRLVRMVAARHANHPASTISFTFPFLVANIDDNDFSREEWPVAKGEQVVPSVVAYPAPSYSPVVFTGERALPRLAAFVCAYCLPSSECVACTSHITEEVAKAVSQLSVEELMTVVAEDSAEYATAAAAFDAFEKTDASATDVARLTAALETVRAAALPFSLEGAVRRVSADGGAAAASDSSHASSVGGEGGGEEGDDAVAETKAVARPVPAVSATAASADAVVSHKRARE